MPMFGSFFTFYNFFFLTHKLIVGIYLPFQIGFLEDPNEADLALNFYLDLVFVLEIVSIFNKPFYDINSRLQTDRKLIARQYLTTWFLLDVLACMPYSYIKWRSRHWPRSKDDIQNFITGNFNSVPRFYKMMLCLKFARLRNIQDRLSFCLKKTALRP